MTISVVNFGCVCT